MPHGNKICIKFLKNNILTNEQDKCIAIWTILWIRRLTFIQMESPVSKIVYIRINKCKMLNKSYSQDPPNKVH